MKTINTLIRKHTAFNGAIDITKTFSGYRPTLYTTSASTEKDRKELTVIADFYDALMERRNDSRRAFRV